MEMNLDRDVTQHYFETAREREGIRRKRAVGITPWTLDPIFQSWRFTNVHRENDKTTTWFRENIRSQLDGLAVVEATVIFRWFNRIESMERVKDLLLNGWDTEEARQRLKDVHPVVTGAYMVHSPYGYSKLDGLLAAIDWARPLLPAMVERWGDSQKTAHQDLRTLRNMGSFSAGEVIWDLRWTPVLNQALDIPTWTIAGPGCARGLGYLVDKSFRYSSSYDQIEMLTIMQELLQMSRDSEYWPLEWEPWELHEAEMWACEYGKVPQRSRGKSVEEEILMKVIKARNVHEAFPLALKLLSVHGVKRNSRNGPVLVAPWPVSTVYSHPL